MLPNKREAIQIHEKHWLSILIINVTCHVAHELERHEKQVLFQVLSICFWVRVCPIQTYGTN